MVLGDVPTAVKAQLQQDSAHGPHRDASGALSSADRGGPMGHLLHKATIPSLAEIAALSNTEKQTQRGCQNEETRKHGPNERTEQNARKELNKMEASSLLDVEFKTLVIGCAINSVRTSTA